MADACKELQEEYMVDSTSKCGQEKKCYRCKGRAVTRKTELRHWNEARISSSFHNSKEDEAFGQNTFEEHETSDVTMETSENIDCEINVVQDVCMNHDNENRNDMEDDFNQGNPYKRLVVKAVLQAMTIVDNSGCSIKTFEDILSYGRTMLFTNLDPEIDEDILASLWPKSWSEVQSLLKEEGFTDPKEYYICICRAEKSFTRNGKTTKKYLYSRKWGIMESKNELCPNCGKCGYIKYYYLGLHEKLKNWFRNLNMCRKMLSHWQEREHWLKRNTSWPLKKEVWDGERWLEVQWFWDPDQLWTVPTRPKFEMPSLALHEAVPGHHLQAAVALESEKQPSFRRNLEDRLYYLAPGRFAINTGYVEGWGLYCEYLGEELKLYTDPYDMFGRLSHEMLRSCRLVVDTGMHVLGWSRDQAVEFMTKTTAMSVHDVNAEVTRYITWPGQACGYKIGELKILELREKARKELGEKFDIRDFHEVFLSLGPVPLAVLEDAVSEYIKSTK
ncbi:predicted protein [Nematostella vectensis]|uniref:DUF885 domain-containing protein n=1 Tax=Nematostella vectensis TaxID=45351 RepID=A7SNZ4_NEMVE|nr:predicted protein [Nematostella vectensis]|eukprot:XP_001626646.1 predicted protein [Nematostella vectensis]